jgi:hypothetical protein
MDDMTPTRVTLRPDGPARYAVHRHGVATGAVVVAVWDGWNVHADGGAQRWLAHYRRMPEAVAWLESAGGQAFLDELAAAAVDGAR